MYHASCNHFYSSEAPHQSKTQKYHRLLPECSILPWLQYCTTCPQSPDGKWLLNHFCPPAIEGDQKHCTGSTLYDHFHQCYWQDRFSCIAGDHPHPRCVQCHPGSFLQEESLTGYVGSRPRPPSQCQLKS